MNRRCCWQLKDTKILLIAMFQIVNFAMLHISRTTARMLYMNNKELVGAQEMNSSFQAFLGIITNPSLFLSV